MTSLARAIACGQLWLAMLRAEDAAAHPMRVTLDVAVAGLSLDDRLCYFIWARGALAQLDAVIAAADAVPRN